jgi:hypothetical protein
MRRPTLYDPFRVTLVGLGAFCLGVAVLLTVVFFIYWRTTDGLVEAHEALVRGETNTVLGVRYTRASGAKTSVPFPEETLPADARPGDRVTVAYMPQSKSAMVYTFRSVWRIPTYAFVLGFALTLIGLFLHPRRMPNQTVQATAAAPGS